MLKRLKKKISVKLDIKGEDNETPAPKKLKKSMKLKYPKVNLNIEGSDNEEIAPTPTEETNVERKKRTKTELSQLHQRYKTMKSENLKNEFTENPDLWHNYHAISEENEASFPDDGLPRNRVIQELDKLKTRRTKCVVDMGCGKAQIAKYFKDDTRFKFTNYDHISSGDMVQSCDISNTPLEDNNTEICILSLAMWGSNCEEYIEEASRILESNGELYIIEPTKRWSEKDDAGNIIPGTEACRLKMLLDKHNFEIKRESIEKFCLFVCIKV